MATLVIQPVVTPQPKTPTSPTTQKPTSITIPDSDIVKAYSDVSGYNPNTGANDNGAAALDVLNYWRKTGVSNHTIYAYAKINTLNIPHVKYAIYLFGGAYLGFQLPLSAQTQDIWDVPPTGTTTGAGVAGSWGGHAVCAIGYDSQHIYLISWGLIKKATWAFFSAYCDEAYVIISNDYVNSGKSPSGFDLTALQADLTALSQ